MKSFLLFGMLASASGAFAQSGVSKATPSAATLTPRVKTALASNRGLIGSNINVDTMMAPRTITLSGVVISPAQKNLAGDIARRNAAGFQVRNLLLVRGGSRVVQTQAISPTPKITGVPVRYARTVQFLQLLSKSQARNDGTTFGQRKTAFPDVERVVSFVSSRGVTIVDVNENNGKPLVLSRARLRRDLKRTGSSAFDSLAYVGYIFAIDYAQYSRLNSKPTRNGVIIDMRSGHRLTWVREGGRLQLRKLEYLRVEGD